jgi:hypothetical protein
MKNQLNLLTIKLKQTCILVVTALSASVTTLVAGYLYVTLHIVQPMQKEAVDNGFATWLVTDSATGATKFAWNMNAEVVYNTLSENDKPLH